MLPDFSSYNAIGSPVFVLTEDDAGDVVYAFMNTAGCRHLLCGPGDVIGKTAAQLFDGRAADAVHERQRRAWQNAVETTYEIAIPIGQDTLSVMTRLLPRFDRSGTLTHMVGVSQDITRERQLEQAHALTAAMTSDMEDFVSFAAHDLRSPIANVRMLTGMLRDGFVDMGDGKLQMIGMIEEISERALDLVTDVLSHSTALRTDVQPSCFDFRSMCQNILVTLDPANAHDVRVDDVAVEADAAAIQIIVRNLIDNAFKYAGLDRVTLHVCVACAPNDRVCISVTDNGRGFANAARVFDPADQSMAAGGYGLVGIRRLVRARGGTIEAGTGPNGVGARVTVTLPGQVLTPSQDDVA
ncbi:PAS domain-containing sensor histidine kinase [Tateyamaria sp. SN6-1]|uniref:PAS domain-containing sensor histidine kinase n=1 Tax=Tateyamaria sp. SN6-1 TaxID=3092148 RepID=UPI0039F47956